MAALIPRNYYYFVASLPSLEYGDDPHMSSSGFEEECLGVLEKKDAAYIPYCRYDPVLAAETTLPTGSPFIDKFLTYERIFILNIAGLRANKLGRPAPAESPQHMPRTVAMAKKAFEMDDPLQAALAIDRNRWSILDTMIDLGKVFGVNNIYIHLLKIKLLERKQILDSEAKGQEKFRECYDAILNHYYSGKA